MTLLEIIKSLPEGYSEGIYNGDKYKITKRTFNDGKSYKIFGRNLKNNDFVSLNYYITKSRDHLKPCEMEEQKVVHFLHNVELINTNLEKKKT